MVICWIGWMIMPTPMELFLLTLVSNGVNTMYALQK